MSERPLPDLMAEKAEAEAELSDFVSVVNTVLGGEWTADRAQQYSDIACRIVWAAFDIATHPDWCKYALLDVRLTTASAEGRMN